MLQARVRGAAARVRVEVLAESWKRLSDVIHNTGQHGEPGSGITASFSRESAVETYGNAFSNSHGCDGVRGPRATRGAGGKSKVSKSIVATDDPAALLESQRNVLLTASVHRNTRGTYASAVKPWFRWRISGRLSVYMCDSDNLRTKQDAMLDFYAHHALTVGYSPGWLHVQVYAIRHYHLLADIDVDLRIMLRLTLAKKGWKRLHGSEQRKIAVTVEILVELLDNCGLNLTTWDDLILVTAISTAFHFLLRSSEYLRKGASPDPEKCLRVEHIVCPINGEDESAPQGVLCTEVVMFMPGAKNDWMGQGTSANIYADEDGHPLCVVKLFNLMRSAKPSHLSTGNSGTHVFTLTSGKVLHRDKVEAKLRQAAQQLHVPAAMVSTHSLRAGGATAMWAAGYSVEEIQRRGRWASQCFRIYIWEGRERAEGVGSRMLKAKVSMFATMQSQANRDLRERLQHQRV